MAAPVSATGVVEVFAGWQDSEIDAMLVLEVFSVWQSGGEAARPSSGKLQVYNRF